MNIPLRISEVGPSDNKPAQAGLGSAAGGSERALPQSAEPILNPYEDDQVDPETLRLLNARNYELKVSKEPVPPLTDLPTGLREMGAGLRFNWRLTDEGRAIMAKRASWIRQRDRGDSEIFGRHPTFYKRNPEMTGAPYA
jgi:hypothetical protein